MFYHWYSVAIRCLTRKQLDKAADAFRRYIKHRKVAKRATNKASSKFPSEGAFMEWAASKNFNCSQAVSTYDWFARKLRA